MSETNVKKETQTLDDRLKEFLQFLFRHSHINTEGIPEVLATLSYKPNLKDDYKEVLKKCLLNFFPNDKAYIVDSIYPSN